MTRVAYVHLARFPVQRRVLETPSLSGKPFVLHEEVRGARRVAFGSTSALKAGVRPGMTLSAAQALLPSLQPFSYDREAEARALLSLGEALLAVAPAFQLSPPDGLWLDPSAAPLFQGEAGFGQKVLALCAEHGYRARVVVASELFSARALGRFGSTRVQRVEPGGSTSALAELPLRALDGPEQGAVAALASLGLTSLGEVAALPAAALVSRLGAEGLSAHRLCRGQDDTPFVPQALAERVAERIELDWPAEQLEPLLFALKTTLDRLCARLSGRKRAAVRLTFTLGLSPDGEAQVPLRLSRPSAQPRLLLDLARHRLADLTLQNPVAALRVSVDEDCEDREQQRVLGDAPQGDAALEVVISRLASTLGEEALFSVELAAVHRPERAYAPRSFQPPTPPPELLRSLREGASPPALPEDAPAIERPSRLFPAPARLEAELGEGGELLGARLLGKRRRATAIAGPERVAGEWWTQEPFARDYYRVHFEGVGPVWVYRDAQDGRFYMQGMFD